MHLHDKMDEVRDKHLETLIRGQSETLELLKQQLATLSRQLKEE